MGIDMTYTQFFDEIIKIIFPRFLYMVAGNFSWPGKAKKNNLKKKELFRQVDG